MEKGGRGRESKVHTIIHLGVERLMFCGLTMARLYRIQVAQLSTALLRRHFTRRLHGGFEESEVGQYGVDN